MRKRGLILLVASVSALAVFVYVASELEKADRKWGYDVPISPPSYLSGVGLAFVLIVLVALVLVLVDHISWRRQKNDRTNKTN